MSNVKWRLAMVVLLNSSLQTSCQPARARVGLIRAANRRARARRGAPWERRDSCVLSVEREPFRIGGASPAVELSNQFNVARAFERAVSRYGSRSANRSECAAEIRKGHGVRGPGPVWTR